METGCHHCLCKWGVDDETKQKCCHCGVELDLSETHVARIRKEVRTADGVPDDVRMWDQREVMVDVSERTRFRLWHVGDARTSNMCESVELLLDAEDARDGSKYYTYVRFIVGPSKESDLPFIRLRVPVEITRVTKDGVKSSMLPHPPCDGFY